MGKVIKPVRLLLFLIAVVLFLYSAYKFIFPMLSLMIIRKCLDSLIRIRLIEMGQTDILRQMKDHTIPKRLILTRHTLIINEKGRRNA